MTERWLLIGTDARIKELAKKMSSPHRTIFFKNTSSWDAGLNTTVLDFCPDNIVLPMQPLSIDVPYCLAQNMSNFLQGV